MKMTIIGGGLFGLINALHFKNLGYKVEVIESHRQLLTQATKINQNRIHYGYHYPRSKETANQALEGLASFYSYFRNCIIEDFENYYLVSKNNSNVDFNQYIEFCKDVKISAREQLPPTKYVDLNQVENAISVREPIFDYYLLRNNLLERVYKSQIISHLESKVEKIEYNGKIYKTKLSTGKTIESDIILNTTYSGINDILSLVNTSLPIKFQDVILPIFEYNIPKIGLTVMDGPFCSILPKGNDVHRFILSNVKNSVLSEGMSNKLPSIDKLKYKDLTLNEDLIYNASSVFFPFLNNVNRIKIWRTTKALSLDKNDGRVSEVFTHSDLPNFYSILQGKVTTCIQIAYKLESIIENKTLDIIV